MQVLDRVELLRQPATDGRPAEMVVQIGLYRFPVIGFQVTDDGGENGVALVSLTVAAAQVRFGGQSAQAGVTAQPAAGRKPWGVAAVPDPREGVPGWGQESEPPLAQQVARQAEARAWPPHQDGAQP